MDADGMLRRSAPAVIAAGFVRRIRAEPVRRSAVIFRSGAAAPAVEDDRHQAVACGTNHSQGTHPGY